RPIDPVHGPGQVYVQAPPRIPVAYPHVPEHLAASRGEKTGHDHGHIMDRVFLTARTGNLLHRLSHPPRGLPGISRLPSGPRLYHEANPTPAHRPDHDEVDHMPSDADLTLHRIDLDARNSSECFRDVPDQRCLGQSASLMDGATSFGTHSI